MVTDCRWLKVTIFYVPSWNQNMYVQEFLPFCAHGSFSWLVFPQLSSPLTSSLFSSQTKSKTSSPSLFAKHSHMIFRKHRLWHGKHLIKQAVIEMSGFYISNVKILGDKPKHHVPRHLRPSTDRKFGWGMVLVFVPKWFMRVRNFV